MSRVEVVPSALERLERSIGSRNEIKGLVRSLLAGVPDEPVDRPAAGPERFQGGYDRVFEQAEERLGRSAQALLRERTAAPALWADLRGHSPEGRRMRIRNDRRFQTWAFCELLAEESERAAETPRRALELAELAVELVKRLDPALYGGERLADLEASVWAAVAEARRLNADLEGAKSALECVREALARGTDDPLARASLSKLEASLAVDEGRFAAAADSLERAIRIHRRWGDPRFEGETLAREALMALAEPVGTALPAAAHARRPR
jgi:tetratricopeptide (TPR) repeat protein